jgi:hypothetical protein
MTVHYTSKIRDYRPPRNSQFKGNKTTNASRKILNNGISGLLFSVTIKSGDTYQPYSGDRRMNRERTLSEITHDAIQILNRELGPIETLRFLRQYTNGVGNYTEERYQWLD